MPSRILSYKKTVKGEGRKNKLDGFFMQSRILATDKIAYLCTAFQKPWINGRKD